MSTTVAGPPKKKRRLRNAAIATGALFVLLLALLLLYFNSASFKQSVRERVIFEIERMTGGRVELAALDWKLSSLQFEARDLTIHGLEGPGEAPYVHAAKVDVAIKILSFFSRKIALSNVAVDQLAVHLIVYPDGTTNQPAPKRERPEDKPSPEKLFELGVNRVEISNGSLILNQQQIPFGFTGERLSAGISYSPQEKAYESNVSMSLLAARWKNMAVQRGDIDLQVLLRSADADVRSLRITTGRSSLQANGTIRNYNRPELRAHYGGSLDLPELTRLAGGPEIRSGHADIKGDLDYSQSRYSTQGTVNLRNFDWSYDGVTLSQLEGAVNYAVTPQRITLTRVAAKLFGGSVRGDVDVSNWTAPPGATKNPLKGVANLQLANIEVKQLAAALPENMSAMRKLNPAGTAGGELKASWTGSLHNVVAPFSLDINAPSNPTPHEVPVSGSVHATYHGAERTLDVAALNLATRAIRVNATGQLGSDKAQARVALNATDLRELKPLLAAASPGTRLPVIVEGRSSFNGSVSGRFDAIAARGRLNLENFDTEMAPVEILGTGGPPGPVQRLHWDSFAGDLAFSPSEFTLQNAVLRRGRATASFSAGASLNHGGLDENRSLINLAVHMENASVEDLQSLFGMKYPVTGVLSGDLKASGTPAFLRGNGAVQIMKITAYGEPFRSFSSKVQLAGREVQLVDLALTHQNGTVTGVFAYDLSAKTSRFELTGSNIDLAAMHIFDFPRLTIAGMATFHVTGSGTADQPVLNGELDLRHLVLNRETVGSLTITAHTRGTDLLLAGRSRFEGSSLNMDGDVQLRGDWPGQMILKFAQLDFDPLIRAYFQGQITGHSSIAGTITIHGPFRRPRDLIISGTADQVSAELEHIKLRNDGPVHFTMDREFARMDQFHLVGENTDAYVQGGMRVSGDHALDLSTRGRLDLRLLQGSNPNIIARGPATFTVRVEGNAAHPQVSGQVDLMDASVSLLDLPNGLSHINGTLVFAQDRVQVQKLTAQSGGGELNVGGFLAYRNGLYFDLTATGKDVRLRYPPGVSSSADASLRYTGSARASLLSGDITVTRFGMNPNFDFANYLAQSRKAPSLSTLNPFLDNLRLDVHITSTPELRVETSLAKLSGDLDLHLRGTAARPALLGRVNIAEGDVFFSGTKYRLERGDITFSNPVTIEPVVNMEMSARVQDYDITVGLHGTVAAGKNLSMTYRSDPPLANADIIALLAFGHTRGQGLYGASQPTGTSIDTADASNAILGQALNATFSDRVQRLFGASRVKIDPQFVGSENNPSARVTIEQTINNNITLTYITSLTQSAQTVVQVEYNINKDVSIVGVRDQNGVLGFDVRIRRRAK